MNIWIVDDDEEMARAVQLMLKLLDCVPRHFLNARAGAQALLNERPPDVLILDINMPEVSGLDMLEFIRRNEKWLRLPIIMLSSEAADVQVDKALDMGADAYIFKPVTIEEMEKAIAMVIKKHRPKNEQGS
jgi:two-component system chemotaxis response regulator CheY